MRDRQTTSSPEELARAVFDVARVWFDATERLTRSMSLSISPMPSTMASRTSCCEIPPPCWMPRDLGRVLSRACPCGTALLRLNVRNCQARAQAVRVSVRTDDSALTVKIVPEHATLEPMQCKRFTLAVTLPDDACSGEHHELEVWLSGCNDHHARWRVTVAEDASGTCQSIEVEDCPDYVHHWYDHFYCDRPCFSNRREAST